MHMSNYAIMRMEKLKSRVSLVGALRHNTREVMPKNADPTLQNENQSSTTVQEALAKYTELIPEKVRKNAVHAVEVVLTASPEWFEKATEDDCNKFIQSSREWLYDVFGRENQILLSLHNDEKTKHIHGIFIPLVDGKLNAKKMIGGTKYRMRELQNEFYEKVGKPLGMDRGVEREKPLRHTTPKEAFRIIEEEKKALKAEREEFQAERSAFNKELFKEMNEDFKGVFKAHKIPAEDTQLFWKSVFETFSRFKAIKKENTKTEVQANEVKKSRSK